MVFRKGKVKKRETKGGHETKEDQRERERERWR